MADGSKTLLTKLGSEAITEILVSVNLPKSKAEVHDGLE